MLTDFSSFALRHGRHAPIGQTAPLSSRLERLVHGAVAASESSDGARAALQARLDPRHETDARLLWALGQFQPRPAAEPPSSAALDEREARARWATAHADELD